jgi:tetratricopeptide (TPR) repeat protein
MARDLNTDLETLRTVLKYAENRDFERAGDLCERTLADGFEHPLLLNVLATRREQQGRYAEAHALLERAVSIAPGDVGARNALALCLQRLDRPAEALRHVDELLKHHPSLSFVHANKGNVLIALGALGLARESHLRALELEPRNLAATAALASIATHRGEHLEARRWAEQALALAPGLPDAVLSLAAADLAAGDAAAAERRLHTLIVDFRSGPSDRARATSMLGDALDALGRHAEAFAAYQTSGDALRDLNRRFADGTSVLAYTRGLTAALQRLGDGEWPRTAPRASAPDKPGGASGHAFLIGFPRSGTTLLEVLLDGHPQVASLEEHELLTDGVLRFMREPLDLKPLAHADDGELQRLREAYWARVRAAGLDVAGKVFIDKYPLNTLKLPLITRLFPRATLLLARRDPRDVVFSCFRRRFKMNPAMYELLTLDGAAAFYDAVMEFAERARSTLGIDWRVVRFESLIADPAAETRAICGALGLEWNAAMLDFAGRTQSREHATPSTAQLARGLDRSGEGSWRPYAAALAPVMPVLAPWVTSFGYSD